MLLTRWLALSPPAEMLFTILPVYLIKMLVYATLARAGAGRGQKVINELRIKYLIERHRAGAQQIVSAGGAQQPRFARVYRLALTVGTVGSIRREVFRTSLILRKPRPKCRGFFHLGGLTVVSVGGAGNLILKPERDWRAGEIMRRRENPNLWLSFPRFVLPPIVNGPDVYAKKFSELGPPYPLAWHCAAS